MATWLVPLTGLPQDPYRDIAAALGYTVETGKDGDWYLTAAELQDIEEQANAVVVAEQLLDLINGYAKLNWPGIRPHAFSWLLRRELDSEDRVITAFPSLSVLGPPGEEVETLLWETEPPTAGYQRKRPRAIVHALKMERIRRALSVYGKGGGLWWALYSTYELIRDDMEGWEAIVRRGWATKEVLDSFRESACHPAISGSLARHGTRPASPRHEAMTLQDAQHLIRMLLARWIALRTDEAISGSG
jgi:hypothetical protein